MCDSGQARAVIQCTLLSTCEPGGAMLVVELTRSVMPWSVSAVS